MISTYITFLIKKLLVYSKLKCSLKFYYFRLLVGISDSANECHTQVKPNRRPSWMRSTVSEAAAFTIACHTMLELRTVAVNNGISNTAENKPAAHNNRKIILIQIIDWFDWLEIYKLLLYCIIISLYYEIYCFICEFRDRFFFLLYYLSLFLSLFISQ